MVSIMPGIENFAPERTETSSGFFTEPSLAPVGLLDLLDVRDHLVVDGRRAPCGLARSRARQASVEMVNPGGTGRPALVISARFAPLPPSVSFIVRSPSALPLPKK